MSNKYFIMNFIDNAIGEVTKNKANKAISLGLVKRVDIINKELFTDFCSMEEFEIEYKKARKEKILTECWHCGKEIRVKTLSKRSYCEQCLENDKKGKEKDLEQYLRLRSKFQFNRAFKILENQDKPLNLIEYKEPGQIIKEYMDKNYNKFDSAHEVVAAIELLKNRIHIKIQPMIEGFKADFMLKEEKVILEIDGYMHEHSKEEDWKRDIKVRQQLGNEWEIVRIPTNYIEKNITRLYEAIMELKGYKQKLRVENNGLLPEYYSKREKQVWEKLL